MSFAAWVPTPGTEAAYTEARAFAEGGTSYSTLLLMGLRGTGKTHLLVGIVRELTTRLTFARYRFVPDLLGELRSEVAASQHNPDYEGPGVDALVGRYATVGMLGLDDLGAGKERLSQASTEWMERIVNHRYEHRLPLVVTTNLNASDMAATCGERIADRLFDTRTGRVKQVRLAAPSFRTGRTW